MKDISKILSSLGLLDSEIKTYLAALKNGASTVLELTKKTKLSRQATYVAIQNLSERGLMTSVQRGKKQYYAAESPDKLMAYAKRREEELSERISDLKQALPELKLQVGGERPTVRLFEGKDGVHAVLEEFSKEKGANKNVYEITDLDAMYKILSPEDLDQLRNWLKKNKVTTYGLYSGEGKPTEVEVKRIPLPDKYSGFNSNVIIFGDKIYLITFAGNMYSVILESKPLAQTLRVLFEAAFDCFNEK